MNKTFKYLNQSNFPKCWTKHKKLQIQHSNVHEAQKHWFDHMNFQIQHLNQTMIPKNAESNITKYKSNVQTNTCCLKMLILIYEYTNLMFKRNCDAQKQSLGRKFTDRNKMWPDICKNTHTHKQMQDRTGRP